MGKGANFKQGDIDLLLKAIVEVKPMGQLGWNKVADYYNVEQTNLDNSGLSHAPRSADSLRKQFNRLNDTKPPTGVHVMPEHIKLANELWVMLGNHQSAVLVDGLQYHLQGKEGYSSDIPRLTLDANKLEAMEEEIENAKNAVAASAAVPVPSAATKKRRRLEADIEKAEKELQEYEVYMNAELKQLAEQQKVQMPFPGQQI